MRIASNVTEVLSRTRALQRDIPVAVERTLRPENWLQLARHYAEKTILALARPAERKFVPDFVKAVSAVAFSGLLLSLDAPAYTAAAVQVNMPGLGEGTFGPLGVPDKDVLDFMNMVEEWVEKEKRWDVERDGPKNELMVREKAEWISYILLAQNLSPVSTRPEQHGSEQEARAKLMPHILDWLQRRQNQDGLSRESADLWLRAVLMQWTAMVHEEFPRRLRAELDLMRRKTQRGLL